MSGIITASDITLEFGDVARPYLLVGEIERRSRRVADQNFEKGEIVEAAHNSHGKRKIDSAEDLTMGELTKLFEPQDRWYRLGWRLDRVTFGKSLDEVRQFRNRLMHFDEEPPTADELALLGAFARTVKLLSRPVK